MNTTVRLVNVREEAPYREWLRHVYAFYLHDLSSFADGEYRLTGSGRWEPDHLPYWLAEPFCHPLVVLVGSDPVGFAFVGEAPFPFMSAGVQFRLSEFFILRSHRRTGVGRIAAAAVFARLPGAFELLVLGNNTPALAFWRAVLPTVASGTVHQSESSGVVRFFFSTAAA